MGSARSTGACARASTTTRWTEPASPAGDEVLIGSTDLLDEEDRAAREELEKG